MELKKVTPQHLLDEPRESNSHMTSSPTARHVDVYETPPSEVLQRGQDFWNLIYGKISKRILSQMDRCGTEDLGLTTSYVLIAGLIPQDVNPQLKGHLRGALNGGASVEELRAIRGIVMDICEASGMRQLSDDGSGGLGWRSEVATV
ncbi:hypothetical protein CSHISOI_00243 [Colletotrichum shisoi]|uniref:Carboxymuconolactone decarboxylase-like domain-containing protein n=1 Tax=Colletotrichum shisoi TaxID=2078593 RepID=A0A5Q4CA46_9PEZI|nr:hypothetical protein CSHISOI_00243 [Colletotrichum shisoi]